MKRFARRSSVLVSVLAISALGFGLSACVNLFDPIDNPDGDAQILSAARAAFDKGDIADARELYGKIAGNQVAISETIFLELDGCGAGIGAFGSALANGTTSAGSILTILGERMAPAHSAACFATLLAAYKSSQNTLTNPNVKGFTSFLAALAIAGEVLAHNTNVQDGNLLKADFVEVGGCSAATSLCTGSCVVSDGISQAAAFTLGNATSVTETWGTLQSALSAASSALQLMGIEAGPAYTLINNEILAANSNSNANYRCILHSLGVGR
jgi:hypothetical protein